MRGNWAPNLTLRPLFGEVCGLPVQVKDIQGDDVICTALNDAHMDGLLTVIHSERGGDGMSSLQTDLPLLTEYDEQAIKVFIKEHEVCAAHRQGSRPCLRPSQDRACWRLSAATGSTATSQLTMTIVCPGNVQAHGPAMMAQRARRVL